MENGKIAHLPKIGGFNSTIFFPIYPLINILKLELEEEFMVGARGLGNGYNVT